MACDDAVDLNPALGRLSATMASGDHRAVLILEGDAGECHQAILQLLDVLPACAGPRCWVGSRPPDPLTTPMAVMEGDALRRRLGTEAGILIVDGFSGFDPEAFCIGAGMVVGGGLMVLMVPPLAAWPAFPDPDLRRLLPEGCPPPRESLFLVWMRRCLQSAPFAVRLPAAVCLGLSTAVAGRAAAAPEQVSGSPARSHRGAAIARQDALLTALLDALTQEVPGPLLVRAERGRGKSVLLGRVLAAVSKRHDWQVRVTGPDQRSVSRLLEVAGLPGLAFTPFDVALDCTADLLVVDEAAAIPVPVLMLLVSRFPRVLMASTQHGYEGSGQGLALRFMPWCQRQGRPVRLFEGLLPMRWASDDPLDAWLQDSFMLREALPGLPVRPEQDIESLSFAEWTASALVEHPDRLRSVMALLTMAHYRTTPSDLRDVLDGPNLHVYVALHHDTLVGVILMALEGPFADAALRGDIMAGRRRPRGHLLPQVLAWHCQAPECLEMPLARIVRIAVAPTWQGRGIGSAMLARWRLMLHDRGIRLFGSSFASDPAVLRFWAANGCRVVREGRRRDQAGGETSMVVLAGTGQAPDTLVAELAAEHAWDERAVRAMAGGETDGTACQASGRWRQRLARFEASHLSLEAAWPALCRWWWLNAPRLTAGGQEGLLSQVFRVGPVEAGQGFAGGRRGLADWLRGRLGRDFRSTWSEDA